MNMWAFTASALEALQQEFELFFAQKVPMDPMKAEFYLPSAVDAMIKAGKADVKVLRSPDKWYGVTYKEDKESVAAAMKALKDNGTYPQELWKK